MSSKKSKQSTQSRLVEEGPSVEEAETTTRHGSRLDRLETMMENLVEENRSLRLLLQTRVEDKQEYFAQDNHSEDQIYSSEEDNSVGKIFPTKKGPNAENLTQVDLLAEAIRISSLKCPTLENNDKISVKSFLLQVEDYKLQGGNRRMSTLIRSRIADSIISRNGLSKEEFSYKKDDEVKSLLCEQFHCRNTFTWNEEISKIKLRKTREYQCGALREYIASFKLERATRAT